MECCWSAQAAPSSGVVAERRRRATGNASVLTVGNSDDCFCYLQKFRVLVCREHATAVQNLESHLRDHHVVAAPERRDIVAKYGELRRRKPAEVALPQPLGPPIKVLGEPLDGYRCKQLDCDYLTVSEKKLKVHCLRIHSLSWRGDTGSLFEKVKVQTFFRAPGFQRYFIVRGLEEKVRESKAEVDTLLAEWKITQTKHEEDMQVMGAEVAKTDKTGWFIRTGWLLHLKERNLGHLAHAVQLPGREERKLKLAAHLVGVLIERSVAGLSTLGRETRRWLRSAQREEVDQRPMARLQNPESQATYASYYVKFVCYFLRIIADEQMRAVKGGGESSDTSDDGETGGSSNGSDSESSDSSDTDSDGEAGDCTVDAENRARREPDRMKDARELFRWHGRQKELAEQLWAVLDEGDEKVQLNVLLKVLASFIFQHTENVPLESGLFHFLAVLGIDAQTKRLRTAKNYSYMLAGMVYCTRVVAVEAILPSSTRDQQTSMDREDFLSKRKEFLADGSFSPMSEMLSLLAYGKHIAMTQGNSGNAMWSDDKKTFYLNGKPVVISKFKQMARDLITEAEDMLWKDVLWNKERDERFILKLDKIVDDVTFTNRGWSFVHRKENGLDNGLEWMLEQMMQTAEGRRLRSRDGRWKFAPVKRYVRSVKRFLERLLLACHVTSGQPGRGTEITTIRRVNGLLQDRNVFVADGRVMTVVRYHKSQSQWDKPKVVPRFLPWRLGQVMVMYLAYVQPFYEYLTVHVLGGNFSEYVWGDEQGPWDTARLTRIIKRETGKRLGWSMTTLDYRHVAVGIGRVAVGESFGRGYEDEVGEVEEAEVEDGEHLLELQSGRSTAIGVGNYSVPIDIVKHLSVRSIEAFRPLSEHWHRFLGLASTRKDRDGPVKGEDISVERAVRKHERDSDAQEELELGLVRAPRQVERKDEQLLPQRKVDQAMRQVLGSSDVAFKSVQQEQAMHAVIDGQTPLVVVLPTGGGKSLLFMVPAYLDATGVTVVVVPYRALADNLVDRIRRSGIDCFEWTHGQVNPATIVVVSADVAGSAGFLSYAELLTAKKLLRRVVIDECHLIFTSSNWRPKLAALRNLRILTCPIVLLTATLPPALEQQLGDSMQIRCATYIRACTVRPNTRYMVSRCKRGEGEEMGLAMCRRRQLNSGEKGVVYCSSKAQCERLARELDCGYYHAEDVDRADRLAEWAEGGGFIVATSALGTGVDFPGIVFILHMGMPWSMIDYAQESGRGGRAGEVVDSVILIEEGEVDYRLGKDTGAIDVAAMAQFIQARGCRRGVMSDYLDGNRVECGDIEAVRCDRCGEGRAEWAEVNSRWAREWEHVQAVMDGLVDVRCVICWVLGPFDAEVWASHWTRDCTAHRGLTGREVDGFRRYIRYDVDTHSCTKCGVSQAYCATGEDVSKKCQWSNILVPIVRATAEVEGAVWIVRKVGFQGALSGDYKEYARWLGKRHGSRVWGEFFSNAMVLFIKMMLLVKGGSS